ncbi:MAG: glycosyltransferase family 4 protein [Dongiaceae bacterium]
MKVLFVANRIPIPCTAGNRARILSLIRALAGWGHEIHYAFADPRDIPAADSAELETYLGGGKYHWIKTREGLELDSTFARGWRKFLRVMKHEAGYRVPLDHGYDPHTTDYLRRLQDRHQFDVVFIEYVFMSKAAEAFPAETLRVLDTHDAFGDRHKAFLTAGQQPSWYSTSLREEETGFRRADIILAIQEEEAERFRRRLGADGSRVHAVSHIIDLSHRIHLSDAPAAAFLGSVNAVNLSALDFLIREVVPRVRERRPDFKLLVAGTISKDVERTDAVEPCGIVANLADLFARAPISLNPMLLGTGVSIKLLDAMACGVPTVSTEIGARGLAPRFRRGMLTVPDNDADAFASAIQHLVADRNLRRSLGEMAFADAVAWNDQQNRALSDIIAIRPKPAAAPLEATPEMAKPAVDSGTVSGLPV